MMTRDQILDAAAQIFRQKGYHAASMQDIAEAVNLQKASLYHHVSSKQEILLALLDRALELLTERVSAAAQSGLSPDEKLHRMVRAYLEAMTEHIDLAAVLLLEHRSLDPELHARHIPNRDRFEALWRETIREGVQQGVFARTDPALAARALLGIMNWTITWYRPDGPLSIHEIADRFADLFLNGLRRR
ncbi:MAG: TetR/AcrR family transcriptional regulator [Anaerolineae bacterium]|nr:MAG: TetR/AcrR family transcriptional regulator [Anaerolineae bacterium]